MKRAACLALLLPIQAWAWEEEPALAFIVEVSQGRRTTPPVEEGIA